MNCKKIFFLKKAIGYFTADLKVVDTVLRIEPKKSSKKQVCLGIVYLLDHKVAAQYSITENSEELICKQMLWLKLENTFSSMGREFYTFLTRRLTVDVISCSRSLGSNGKLHKCKAVEITGLW